MEEASMSAVISVMRCCIRGRSLFTSVHIAAALRFIYCVFVAYLLRCISRSVS